MKIITLTKAELKTKAGRDFQDGDVISVGKYEINIKYGQYDTPSLKSWVFDTEKLKVVSSWPAGARGCWPYFIRDFLWRESTQKA